MGSLKTIQVRMKKFGDKAVIINEADFDPKIHTHVDDKSPDEVDEATADSKDKAKK